MTNTELRSDPQSSGADSSPVQRSAHGIRRRLSGPQWRGRAVAVCLSASAVVFVAGFVLTIGSGGQLALVTKPPALQVVFALPYLVTVLAAGTVASAISAWWHGYWSLLARIHQTILAALGIVFVWQLVALGFVP